MDFKSFKKEKLNDILAQFLDPEILTSYRMEYGICFENVNEDIESYEELYKTIAYSFLLFGRAISKTISDIRVCEVAEDMPIFQVSPMERFLSKDKSSLVDKAWYWVSGTSVCDTHIQPSPFTWPPIPMRYFADKDLLQSSPDFFISCRDGLDPGLTIWGRIPEPQWESE